MVLLRGIGSQKCWTNIFLAWISLFRQCNTSDKIATLIKFEIAQSFHLPILISWWFVLIYIFWNECIWINPFGVLVYLLFLIKEFLEQDCRALNALSGRYPMNDFELFFALLQLFYCITQLSYLCLLLAHLDNFEHSNVLQHYDFANLKEVWISFNKNHFSKRKLPSLGPLLVCI
jgi:hypothetical protein